MVKYNDEFKIMVVREYQEGKLGYKLLTKKYDGKSHKQIINCVKNYEEFRTGGLKKEQREVFVFDESN